MLRKLTILLLIFMLAVPMLAQDDTLSESVQGFAVELLLMVITLYGGVIVGAVVLWSRQQIQLLKTRLSEEQLYFLQTTAEMIVKAAEKAGLTGVIENHANAKLNYAMKGIESALRDQGLEVLADNKDLIRNAIEAAINDGVHKTVDTLPTAQVTRFKPVQ